MRNYTKIHISYVIENISICYLKCSLFIHYYLSVVSDYAVSKPLREYKL